MKKITIQDIADSLGISRTSVWKVFSDRDGVSEDLRKKVIEKAQELNYNLPKEFLSSNTEVNRSAPVNIAMAVCRPESSIFWMTIIHEIAKELSMHNMNLMYIYLPTSVEAEYQLPAQFTNSIIHGIIVINVYNERLIQLLAGLSVPKVFMDTSNMIPYDTLNGDLILSEGKSSVFRITEHLIRQSRKKIGFIGDIHYARTNYERYEGFIQAMDKHKLPVKPEHCLTAPIGIDAYEEVIGAYVKSLKSMPEAFVCVNDYMAGLLWQALNKLGYEIPDDIAVTGFDGNTESPISAELTTVQISNKDLGRRLATQIMYRIQHPHASYEVTYISSEVIFRNSTQIPPTNNEPQN